MNMETIYFASNRDVKHETSNSCKNLGKRFNQDGPQFFRLGKAEVLVDGDPKDDDNWSPSQCSLYPENLGGQRQKIGSDGFFEELRELIVEHKGDVIIYLHGFANDFADSVIRAGALQHVYRKVWDARSINWEKCDAAPPLFVMFSWPSNGNVFPRYEYFSDREDAEASGIAMARALHKFVQFLEDLRTTDSKKIREHANRGAVPPPEEMKQCGRKLHLLAHSMGNWAARHTVNKFSQLVARRPLPRIFDNAFLVAADDDADTLGDPHKLGNLVDLANNVHVYHSRDDLALEVADRTKGLPARLGSDGPTNFATLNERISAVDCRFVDRTITSHGNHQYYRLRDEVVEDILMTVAGNKLDWRNGRDTLMPGRAWRLKSG